MRKTKTAKEKVKLINKCSKWFYDHTSTFEGMLGAEIAYLYAAICRNTKIDLLFDSELLALLKEEKYPDEDIWEYIDLMD